MAEEKSLIGKLKEGVADKEEQLQVLGTFVRLGVVVWSGFIISLNYLPLPGMDNKQNNDITFITFVFTSALATFGIDTAKKKFDPNFHQAMTEIENDNVEAGTIVQEIQAGYMLGERLLRPSLVAVSKKSVKNEEKNEKKK